MTEESHPPSTLPGFLLNYWRPVPLSDVPGWGSAGLVNG